MEILTHKQAEQKLVKLLPNDVRVLANLFNKSGFDLFLVGGCIRDVFLKKTPKDFDVCTNALPEEVMDILSNNNIDFQLQGEAFGVVVAKMSEEFEIATFRTDTDSGSGSNKETIVTLGVTIEDDCNRRDLTINALFMDIAKESIIDLIGGVNDLKNGIIRTVGKPQDRFKEDNLRKLRAIRFKCRLGFEFDEETFLTIKNDNTLNVTEERIVTELFNAFSTTKSIQDLINTLIDTNLIHTILPNIILNDNVNVDKINSFSTFLAVLIDLDKEISLDKRLTKLKFDTKTINNIMFLKKFNTSDVCPVEFISKRKSTSLSNEDIISFHFDKFGMKTLVEFKTIDGLSEVLMEMGLKNKPLGDEIKKQNKEKLISELNKLF